MQKSKELRSQRPIEESAVLAEIGRVITLSLDVDQVYKGFAEEVKKLIPFDRISISITDVERGESYVKNITGFNPDDLQMGGTRPLAGSLALAAISTRSGALFQPQDVNEVVQRLPKLLPYFQAGLRSFIGVPLVFKDVVIGALNYHSLKPNAYSEQDVELARRVANQIAGAIANSRLYEERERAEFKSRKLAHENAVLAEISRVISSSLDIGQVYKRFAEQVKKLIPFDRVSISAMDVQRNEAKIEYVAGMDVERLRPGETFPLEGALVLASVQAQSGLLYQPQSIDEVKERFPQLLPLCQAGLSSFLTAPLVSRDQIIGLLGCRSTRPNAYTGQDLELAERVANQIAGAIANSRIYTQIKKAEDDRKHTADRLLEQSQILWSVLDNMTEGVIVTGHDDEFLVFNKSAERITGMSPKYKSPEGWSDGYEVMRPDDLTPFPMDEQPLIRALRGQHSDEVEMFIRNPNKPEGLYISANASPLLDKDGNTIGGIGVFRDVTAYRQAQRELIVTNARLMAANESKTEFLTTMSHELRTPLNAILGFARLLSEAHFGELNTKQCRFVDNIISSGSHLLQLINDLIDLSKIEPDELHLDICEMDVASCLASCYSIAGGMADNKGLDLKVRYPSEPIAILADERRVKQIIFNLLSNAIKFTPKGGEVYLAASTVDDGLSISVKDTGIGIAPQHHKRIFQLFDKGAPDIARQHGGSGLGLPLVRQLVEMHGGSVKVKSVVDEGSVFTVVLPLASQYYRKGKVRRRGTTNSDSG